MTQWYRVYWFRQEIEQVNVVRTTKTQVIYHQKQIFGDATVERRSARHSPYESFYPSFDEAKSALLEHVTKKLHALTEDVRRYQRYVTDVAALKEKQ